MCLQRTILAASLLAAIPTLQAATPTNKEIWQQLQHMQRLLSEIEQQNQQLQTENKILKDKIDATEQVAREANEAAEAVTVATEEAVEAVSRNANKTTLGGYGELHYNSLNDQNGNADKDEIDFHRFVLFLGHEFSNELRFFSELEVEHTVVEAGSGAVELEQAYIQYDINDKHQLTGGSFLVPVGIINETHEPNTFYGTERNPVEKNIIPTTWWEGGVMVSGQLTSGFSYDVAFTSGLNTGAGTNYQIRKGRQQLAQATAKDPAYTGRLKWTGIPGVELAASLQYQQDITQRLDATAGRAILFETHAVIQQGQFGLRALYARWDLSGSGPQAVGAGKQVGWYVEPSYRIHPDFGVFARFNTWDNQAGDQTASQYQQWNMGFNWWPHKDVVIKLDYQVQDVPAGKTEFDGLNIGLGYQF